MAIRKYLARDFIFQISTDNRATWTTISGINSWTWATDSNDEDASTFDSGAWGSSMYTQRTGSTTLEGFYLVDSVTKARDQGQLLVERAATKVGYDAYRDFQIICSPLVSGARGPYIGSLAFTGQAAMSDMGGNTTDIMPWGVDLVWDGAPTGSGIFDIFN